MPSLNHYLALAALLTLAFSSPVWAGSPGDNYSDYGISYERKHSSCGGYAEGERCLTVLVDHAQRIHFDQPVSMLVVGNPAIADISVQHNNIAFVKAHSVGATNIIALDEFGNEIVSYEVFVREPTSRKVTVRRGTKRETYLCAPNCTRSLSIGDSSEATSDAANAINIRSGIENSALGGYGSANQGSYK